MKRLLHDPKMRKLLKDPINLKILHEICAGFGVNINLSYLSRKLKKHRSTIKARTDELIKSKIINEPIFPFFGQYMEHPLLILVFADLPHCEQTIEWLRKDKHIFNAFKIRKGSHNTLLMLFQKNILNYQLWRDHLVKKGKIPPRDIRTPSEAHFYSNQLMVKYNPEEGIKILKEEVKRNKHIILNGYKLGMIHIAILELILNGEGIWVNETELSNKLDIHKKTLRRRLKIMLDQKLILKPTCRFHNFLAPPNFIFQLTKVEIKKNKDEVIRYLKSDPHIPFALQICEGRFNFLLFEIFSKEEESVDWSSQLRERFIKDIGDIETTLIKENNSFDIDQQKVSMGAIKDCIKALELKNEEYFDSSGPNYFLFNLENES